MVVVTTTSLQLLGTVLGNIGHSVPFVYCLQTVRTAIVNTGADAGVSCICCTGVCKMGRLPTYCYAQSQVYCNVEVENRKCKVTCSLLAGNAVNPFTKFSDCASPPLLLFSLVPSLILSEKAVSLFFTRDQYEKQGNRPTVNR